MARLELDRRASEADAHLVLTRVKVSGLKAIPPSGVDLELRPLTLLIGPTGSGKSSILEAIALLAQSIRTQRVQLTTSGRLVRLGDDDTWPASQLELVHAHDKAGSLSIQVSIAETWRGTFGFRASELGKGQAATFEQWIAEGSHVLRVGRSSRLPGGAIARIASTSREIPVGGDPTRLLDKQLFTAANESWATSGLAGYSQLADRIADFLSSPALRYLGEWRGVPALVSTDPGGRAASSGSFGENILRIALQSGTRGKRLRGLADAAARFGLPNFHVGIDNGQLTPTFEDPISSTTVRLEHAGAGSLQALPILADLTDLDAHGVLMVEEPERGWHPKFLAGWADTFADAVRRGVQIIATTHSPDLVLACALAIKRGALAPDAFVAYDLDRTASGITAKPIHAAANGRLTPSFVPSYAAAESALLGELIDTTPPRPQETRRAPSTSKRTTPRPTAKAKRPARATRKDR